jgi:hypothetical protein
MMPLARAAEEEARRADPELPEAHALLGVCAGGFEHDWIGGTRVAPVFRSELSMVPVRGSAKGCLVAFHGIAA